MHLTAQTDFGLRLLMYVEANRPRRVTIQEVSQRLNLSQAHLMRISANLVAVGFLRSARGRSGGLELAKSPSDILIGDVIRALEPDFRLVECFASKSGIACRFYPKCRLRVVFEKAMEAFFSELDKVSLENLAVKDDEWLVRVVGTSLEPVAKK